MKQSFEMVSQTVNAIWAEYYESDTYTYAEADTAVVSVLRDAGWTVEEYDREVIDRSADEPGCRLAAAKDCNA